MSAPGLRARTSAPATTPSDPNEKISSQPRNLKTAKDDDSSFSPLDIVRVLSGLLFLSCTLSYFVTGNSFVWGYPRPGWSRPARIKAWWHGPLSLTDKQLALYNGTDTTLPILLALNGSIYDVSASPHLYGPGGSYSFFSGRDATRAFVTGCFDTDLTGDMRGVEEMFMPLDDNNPEGNSNAESTNGGINGKGVGDKAPWTKEQKREQKLRRERERRLAKKKVHESVEGWRKMFDGGKEGRYFWRGTVDRGAGSGWEGWGDVKELCESARQGRKRRTAEEVGR